MYAQCTSTQEPTQARSVSDVLSRSKSIFSTSTHYDEALSNAQPLSSVRADSETLTAHGKLSPLLEEISSDTHPQFVYMRL